MNLIGAGAVCVSGFTDSGSLQWSDAFTGATLDTDKWDSATKGASSTVTQNDKLILTGTSGAVSSARVKSKLTVPTTGVVTVKASWTPGKLYSSAYGRPYIAIIPAAPTRDTANYEFPYLVPGVRLGKNGDTTSRTNLAIGTFGSQLVAYGSPLSATSATISAAENTAYALVWRINWSTSKMTILLDAITQISGFAFSYTPSGDHYLELGYCDYGAASNPIETFDSVEVWY